MIRAKREYLLPSGKTLRLGERTLVMGILNVTPDSFSDGGRWLQPEQARLHVKAMVEAGADIIDIGAESTRPGSVPITAEEELSRLRPCLEAVSDCPLPISVDTYKAETAREALSMGADFINDIWGLQYEAEPDAMAQVAAEAQVPVVVMHNQAEADRSDYGGDVIAAEWGFFRKSCWIAEKAGLARENLILDPGIGFGKNAADNLQVIRRLGELTSLGGQPMPVLLGVSRKSFIGKVLGLPVEERLEAGLAACVLGVQQGASIVRVHDVAATVRAVRMTEAILRGQD